MTNLFNTFADTTIGTASHVTNSQMQSSLLEQSKALAQSGLQLMYVVKEAGGNPKNLKAHAKVDVAVEELTDTIEEFLTLLKRVDDEVLLLAGKKFPFISFYLSYCYVPKEMVDAMTKARFNIGVPLKQISWDSSLEYQMTALNQSKQLLKCTQEFITKCTSSMEQMFKKANDVKAIYCQLVETTRCCLATIESDQACLHDATPYILSAE